MTTTLMTVRGVTAEITERRRYGNQPFTWVEFTDPAGTRHWCADPWPAVTPKKAEVTDVCNRIADAFEAGRADCRCSEPIGTGGPQ